MHIRHILQRILNVRENIKHKYFKISTNVRLLSQTSLQLTMHVKLYVTNLYNEIDERQIDSNCNAEEEIKHSRLHTATDSDTHNVVSVRNNNNTNNDSICTAPKMQRP